MPVAGVADAQDFPRGRARRAESAPAPPASEAESIEQLTRSNIEVIPRLERERQARRPWACRMAAWPQVLRVFALPRLCAGCMRFFL